MEWRLGFGACMRASARTGRGAKDASALVVCRGVVHLGTFLQDRRLVVFHVFFFHVRTLTRRLREGQQILLRIVRRIFFRGRFGCGKRFGLDERFLVSHHFSGLLFLGRILLDRLLGGGNDLLGDRRNLFFRILDFLDFVLRAHQRRFLLGDLLFGGRNLDFVDRGRAHRVLKRSEEHTSELQSRPHLVCRLLL